jgi:predicted GNAT superfamily acetyltransferase
MVAWRMATRAHFQWAFLNGYQVTAFHRDRVEERAFYVISRASHDAISRAGHDVIGRHSHSNDEV